MPVETLSEQSDQILTEQSDQTSTATNSTIQTPEVSAKKVGFCDNFECSRPVVPYLLCFKQAWANNSTDNSYSSKTRQLSYNSCMNR